MLPGMDRQDLIRRIEASKAKIAPKLAEYEALINGTKGKGENGADRPFTAEEDTKRVNLGKDINAINSELATDRGMLKALNLSEACDDETADKLGLSDRSKLPQATDEYMEHFLAFAGSGFDQRANPDAFKNLTGDTSTGNVLIPTVLETKILMEALSQSPLFEISDVTFTTSLHTQIPFMGTIGVMGPRKQAEAYVKTEPALAVKSVDIYNYGGIFPVSQELMDDADGLDAAFRAVWAEALAETIEEYGWKGESGQTAFTDQAGAGTTITLAGRVCPGILSLGTGIIPAVANSAAAAIAADDIIKLKQAVKPSARRDGVYVISGDFETKALLLKDSTGQPIWRPNLIAGQPSMLNGSAYHVSDRLDAVAASKTPALFGAFKRAHEIKIRKGLMVKKSEHFYFGNGMIAIAGDVRWGAGVRYKNLIARLNTPAS
jgi:HK97 family phage major capsid protein